MKVDGLLELIRALLKLFTKHGKTPSEIEDEAVDDVAGMSGAECAAYVAERMRDD